MTFRTCVRHVQKCSNTGHSTADINASHCPGPLHRILIKNCVTYLLFLTFLVTTRTLCTDLLEILSLIFKLCFSLICLMFNFLGLHVKCSMFNVSQSLQLLLEVNVCCHRSEHNMQRVDIN